MIALFPGDLISRPGNTWSWHRYDVDLDELRELAFGLDNCPAIFLVIGRVASDVFIVLSLGGEGPCFIRHCALYAWVVLPR